MALKWIENSYYGVQMNTVHEAKSEVLGHPESRGVYRIHPEIWHDRVIWAIHVPDGRRKLASFGMHHDSLEDAKLECQRLEDLMLGRSTPYGDRVKNLSVGPQYPSIMTSPTSCTCCGSPSEYNHIYRPRGICLGPRPEIPCAICDACVDRGGWTKIIEAKLCGITS